MTSSLSFFLRILTNLQVDPSDKEIENAIERNRNGRQLDGAKT